MNEMGGNYFEHLVESLGFICISVDRELKIRTWNQQAKRHFGQTQEAMMGRSILDVLPEADRPAAEHLLLTVMDKRTAGDGEIKYVGAEDQVTTFVFIVSPIIDSHGQCVGASASMRDISERKRLSKELGKSRRMASLGKMAGGVAHHFNNILGGMQTSIDAVLASDSPRELRKCLRLLSQEIGRATRITHQLAAFAESENEQVEAAPLRELIAAFLEWLRRACTRAGVELVTDIQDVQTGPLDGSRLRGVLESIAQNALDAMVGGGKLAVSVKEEDAEAVITVGDTGCGMPEETLEHIFEPFFTTKGDLGGGATANIGLGLAAVHGLVAEMGGTIRIKSKIGQGTLVTIRLPSRRDEAENESVPGNQSARSAGVGSLNSANP